MTPAVSPDTFLDELCKHLCTAERYAVLGSSEGGAVRPYGFTRRDGFAWRGATGVPELRPLAAAFDRVLVRSDGFSLEVLCLVDRLARPERKATVGLEELIEVGRAGLRYTASSFGNKQPVLLRVWEVGAPDDHAHLEPLHHNPGSDRVGVTAAAFGPASDHVWTNASLLGRWAQVAAARRARQAVLAGEAPTAPSEIGRPGRTPVVTYALLGVVAAVYLLEITLGRSQGLLTPTGATLVAFGALQRDLVLAEGQWYRMASAALLHGSPLHLFLNGFALYFGGALLERLIGRRWFLAVFGLSALGGSAASMLLNPPEVISVGASGAILGLFGAALAVSFRIPYGGARTWVQSAVVRVLIPSLLPLFVFQNGPRIDYGAHLGGAAVGLVVGLFLVASWPRSEPLPRHRGLATALAIASALVLAGGFAMAMVDRPAMEALLRGA